MGLCRAWLSAGPVAWQAVQGAANRGDLGLEGSLVFFVCTRRLLDRKLHRGVAHRLGGVGMEAGKGAGDLLPSLPISPPVW